MGIRVRDVQPPVVLSRDRRVPQLLDSRRDQLRPVDGDHVRPVAEYASDEKESGISCSCHMGFQHNYGTAALPGFKNPFYRRNKAL